MGNLFSNKDKRLEGTRVVVIGGSIAGIQTAKALEAYGFTVSVIEPRDHLFIPFGSMRAGVSANAAWAKRVMVPLDRALKQGKILRGYADGIDMVGRVVTYTPLLKGGIKGTPTPVPFDYLVIATGANFRAPFTPTSPDASTSRASLLALGETIRAAISVVVVGGGPCGVEMVGEIRDASPGATITLVHSGSALLTGPGNASPPQALSAKLIQRLKANNIGVVLSTKVTGVVGGSPHPTMGDTVLVGKEMEVTCSQGSPSIKGVDVVVYATGSGKPATAWLANTPLASALDATTGGGIKASRAYAVPGFDGRVFAAGDCVSGPDAKAGWLLEQVAGIIAHNIRALALREVVGGKSTPPPTLKEGPKAGFKDLLVVPIGAKDGAGALPFGVVGPFLVSTVKGGDLFLGKMGGMVGYTAAELIKQ